ncbi:sarcosine oxidase subunit gamma [Rhodobacterales bacterium 52_120_T64]|nr:sarcosine oxidase subunit gamma [Rhodobacterales bacterium 52_120_T64]
MSNAISILNGATFDGAVKITEAGLRGMITLRGDLSSVQLKSAVSAVVGLGIPTQRKINRGPKGGVAWMSPDELLLLVDYDNADAIVAEITTAMAGEHHMAVNVSDARAVFLIEGQGAREVLAKGAPVDLSTDAFRVGDLRRSRIGQLAAAFWMTEDDHFELVCFRSVGAFMFDWLSNAAREGSVPKYF